MADIFKHVLPAGRAHVAFHFGGVGGGAFAHCCGPFLDVNAARTFAFEKRLIHTLVLDMLF